MQIGEVDPAEAYQDFWQDLLLEAEASGDSQNEAFFRIFASMAAENGDCLDLTYHPVRREGSRPFQIDGYAIDPDRGELQVAICDLNPERELQTLNAEGLQSLVARMARFCEQSTDPAFLNALEESSPAYEVAYHIGEFRSQIRRIRLIVFSNARLATRKKVIDARKVLGTEATINVVDFIRYSDLLRSQGGFEPIEIDVEELNGSPLPCLEAHLPDGDYKSFLAVVPGDLLAKLYGVYGTRLMEQNVRTFLQVKTKVNRGINQTIRESPEMFFAYNNGITATATDVSLVTAAGATAIRTISDLQIVNGGQTTASLLLAHDKMQADLSQIFVQMKLSVVRPERVEEVVPNISRFANTQNRISEADFFSGHPFHVEMEKLSKQLTPPLAPGALTAQSWFYERARGQYANALAGLQGAARRKFEKEFPRTQLIKKTELAKYVLSYAAKPHIVSLGEQKCFKVFADDIKERWDTNKDQFNDAYFKRAVAMTILFRFTDGMIGRADWYRSDRGYKANYVTYTIAWLLNYLRTEHRSELDLMRIWSEQGVPQDIRIALGWIAPKVAAAVRDAPVTRKNVSEYAKDVSCWQAVSRIEIPFNDEDLLALCISIEEAQQQEKDAVRQLRSDGELQFEAALLRLIPRVPDIRAFAQRKRILSPQADKALGQLSSRALTMTRTDKNALKNLFSRIENAGGGELLGL